jgi:SAM-dependent methyltransferase
MLNCTRWNEAGFHETLVSLTGATLGENVLDLGCGHGASLGALLNAVGAAGTVFGFDRLTNAFDKIARQHSENSQCGRLVLLSGDVLDLPFSNETFDAVLCQNVVECVHDRQALVAQAKRVLKPGGRLLLGHHDYDGIMIAGSDRELTQRLVQGYADHKQDWQDTCEGQMGRLLPGLVADAGFKTIEIHTRIFADLDLSEGSYARIYVGGIIALAPAFGVDRGDAQRWADELLDAAMRGHFFFALPWIGAICWKAAG